MKAFRLVTWLLALAVLAEASRIVAFSASPVEGTPAAKQTASPQAVSLASGNIVPAASCSQADVQAAVDAAQDSDTVTVPAGECTWMSPENKPAVLIDQKAITVQGSGPNATIINDSTGSSWGDYALKVNGVLGKPFRITGFRFQNAGGGGINIVGTAMDWRIDRCEFTSPSSGWTVIGVNGYSYGVIHDSTFFNSRVIHFDGSGHDTWKRPLDLGAVAAVYIESCQFTRNEPGNAIDSNHGGKYVFRFNTVTNSYCEAHSLQNAIVDALYGFGRATRSYEIYHNKFEAADSDPSTSNWVAVFVRGGTGVVFGNSAENRGGDFYNLFGVVDNVRSFSTRGAPLLSCDGTNPLDGNEEANGYPCLDQIGRSTDFGPGDQFHPQRLEPLYAWNNTLDGLTQGLGVHNDTGHHIQEGRDFYNNVHRPHYVPYPYPHPLTLVDYPGEQRALELQGRAWSGQAQLSWQAVTGAASYRVVRDWDETGAVTTTDILYYEDWVGPEHAYMVYALNEADTILAAEGVLVSPAVLTLHGAPANQAIHLSWDVNADLPPTSTWRIDYYPLSTAVVPPISLTQTVRAYTLTGLTNYVWYTVMLNAMLEATPFLTDTVHVMPTGHLLYLPVILKGLP